MRRYKIAISLSDNRQIQQAPVDIFGDLSRYHGSPGLGLNRWRKSSVSTGSPEDYRRGPITVEWVDFNPHIMASSPTATRKSAEVNYGAQSSLL